MRPLLAALALLALAGCSYGPEPYVKTSNAIAIFATPDRQQAAENMATRHCAQTNAVPHLVHTSMIQPNPLTDPVPALRFECVTPPSK